MAEPFVAFAAGIVLGILLTARTAQQLNGERTRRTERLTRDVATWKNHAAIQERRAIRAERQAGDAMTQLNFERGLSDAIDVQIARSAELAR